MSRSSSLRSNSTTNAAAASNLEWVLSPNDDDEKIVEICGQFELTKEKISFAAWHVIPRATFGALCTIYAFFYFFHANRAEIVNHIGLLLWPVFAGYFGTVLLWSRYTWASWRRPFDITIIVMSIMACAVNMLVLRQECADVKHQMVYLALSGAAAYWFTMARTSCGSDWYRSVRVHSRCHWIHWASWCVLYSMRNSNHC